MPDFKIFPWRDMGEVTRLRGMFYAGNSEKHLELRKQACETVAAWGKRGGVPHAVVATSALTNAILNDNPKYTSVQSISAVYSTAYSQFVTGLTDVEQTSKSKKSMFDIGREIGLPSSFIDLRHRITHEGQVSLVELRHSAREGLNWLYEYYWKQFMDNQTETSDGKHDGKTGDQTDLRAELKSSLRWFKKKRLGTEKKLPSKSNKKFFPGSIDKVVKKLGGLCLNKPERLVVLVDVLLHEGLLIPPTKVIGSPIDEAIEVYNSLLRSLCYQQTKFLVVWLDEMIFRLVQRGSHNESLDSDCEAIFFWLKHVYNDSSWDKVRKTPRNSAEAALRACIATPRHWTLRLAVAIINEPRHQELKTKYEAEVYRIMKKEDVPDTRAHEVAARGLALVEQRDTSREGVEQPWIPRPIGTISMDLDGMMLGSAESGKTRDDSANPALVYRIYPG